MDGDAAEQFNRNEAISAVVDEGFLGEEEEDDDYEDLYNDVNVGDAFQKSVQKNDLDLVEEESNKMAAVPVSVKLEPEQHPQSPAPAAVVVEERKFESNERVELGPAALVKVEEVEGGSMSNNNNINNNNSNNGMGNVGMGIGQQPSHTGGDVNGNGGGGMGMAGSGVGGAGGGGGGTVLFVGDLHWWTTDAELESELCKYGHVKEVKFFDEKASGKSKGYCQVEFYDPGAATACKEGMNGHVFNGRPCVVAYASPFSVKRMGEAQVNRSQQMAQSSVAQAKRGPGDPPVKTGGSNMPAGGNFQSGGGNFQGNGGDNNRGYGRANWNRGNGQGMGGRGPRSGGMGGRGPRAMMGNGGNGFGPPPMMHPQSMMGQGFDPSFGGPMGRMGNYGGFPGGPTPPFSGMLPNFPPGLPGLAPHVNPAFFGRGMPMNGMGMMPTNGVDGPNMGMWSDPNMVGWAGDEQGGRVGESSYGEEAVSDQQYREEAVSDRRPREDREREPKEVVHEDEWPERRHREERESGRERERERESHRERSRDRDRERGSGRDRHRDERDRYADHHHHHRYKDAEPEYDDEWDRGGRSSRAHGKSRMSHEDEHRSKSRDADYGKRRRVAAE